MTRKPTKWQNNEQLQFLEQKNFCFPLKSKQLIFRFTYGDSMVTHTDCANIS